MLAQRVKAFAQQRATKAVQQQAARKFGAHSHNPYIGNSTSPHYADFGYGPHQMLPPHEFMRYPVKAKPTEMPHHYKYLVPVNADTGHQTLSNPPTGLFMSLQTEWEDQASKMNAYHMASRKRAAKIWFSAFFVAISWELYMHGGFRHPSDKVWEDVTNMNIRMAAMSLQHELCWEDFQKVSMEEVFRVISNRPYLRKNPYIITKVEEEIAARNKNEQGPLSAELYDQKMEYALSKVSVELEAVRTWSLLTEAEKAELLPFYSNTILLAKESIDETMEELKDLKHPEVEKMIDAHQAILNRAKSDQYARSLKFIEAKLDL